MALNESAREPRLRRRLLERLEPMAGITEREADCRGRDECDHDELPGQRGRTSAREKALPGCISAAGGDARDEDQEERRPSLRRRNARLKRAVDQRVPR